MLDLNDPKQAHKDQRLRSDPIIWLCSVRPNGRPHAAAVWFLWDGSSILIFSMPTAQKVRNLRHEPRVTLALDDTHAGDDPITLEGTAEILEPSVVTTQLPAYAEKYGELMKEIDLPPDKMAQIYSQPIPITPTRF